MRAVPAEYYGGEADFDGDVDSAANWQAYQDGGVPGTPP
jgi:hypothetical protein